MKTIIELFENSVNRFSDNMLLWEKKNGAYSGTTYREVHQQVKYFAAGLLSLGIQKNDRVALLSEGRNQWIISELGIFYAGAVCVPLSVKLEAGQDLVFRLRHSGTRMIIVSSGQAPKVEAIKEQLPGLEKIISLDETGNDQDNATAYKDIIAKGMEFLKDNSAVAEQIWQAVEPDDLANISYTSGTTSDPKGVMLSQLNYAANVIQANSLMSIPPDYITLAFLPWDHSFAHTTCIYCMMYNGASVASSETGKTPMETLRNIPKNIKEIKPHVLMSVPAVAKNFRKGIETGIRQKGALTQKLFDHALAVSYKYNGIGRDRGKGTKAMYKPLIWLYDKILFSKIRESFGGRLKFFIGGGALLDIELQRFFYAIGIPMCQGYGLSEASPVISANALHAIKFGSSGKPVKYMELKIIDDQGNELPTGVKGEIAVKGDNVMKGYWQNPKATEETIVNDWLHTGDMGYMDEDGFLYVLGRFKSLLISSDGEKYSPESIEEALVGNSPFIDQCMLYNNQSPYTSGFVVPNTAALNTRLTGMGIKPGTDEGNAASLDIIQEEINKYKKGGEYETLFPERWLPATVAVLPEAFTEQNRLINSTMKMVRDKIYVHFAEELKFLYTPEARNIVNDINLKAMARWNASGNA